MAKLFRTQHQCFLTLVRNNHEQLSPAYMLKKSRKSFRSDFVCNGIRQMSAATYDRHAQMRAWQISRFQEDMPDFSLVRDAPFPNIQQPNDVIIEVNAASINPLDVQMAKGYGRNVLKAVRQTTGLMLSPITTRAAGEQAASFPITLGRDFSGIIVDAGPLVRKFKVGDAVYGTVAAHRPGSHAEYTVTSATCIGHKPPELTDVEAASLPWVACTTYSALVYSGRITPSNASQRSVLLIGAGGGLGTFAVQLLKAWNTATVVALVRGSEQASHVRSLCALAEVIDTNDVNFLQLIEQYGPFDMLLDAAGDAETADKCAAFLRKNLSSRFVTLSSPLLKNTDHYRLLPGTALSAAQLAKNAISAATQGYQYHWAFYTPNGRFLDGNLRQLLAEKRVKPVIQQEFGFSEVPQAFQTMTDGSSKGKVVINVKTESMQDYGRTGKQKISVGGKHAAPAFL